MRKTAKYSLEIALLADGVPPGDVYKVLSTPSGVDRAFKKLDELKPEIVWWTNVSQVQSAPETREAGAAYVPVIGSGASQCGGRHHHHLRCNGARRRERYTLPHVFQRQLLRDQVQHRPICEMK
jgi:hypothetical protein